jgi:AcrR family transcriptional regulator
MPISATFSRRGRPRGSDGDELLTIARQTFIANGFRGTTMDAVAARAHISKQSLYRMYPSKDALYAAVVRGWVEQGHDAMRPHTTALSKTDDITEGLLQLARITQAGLLSPPVLQMRTLIAAEATRFPEVAADYVTRSWAHNLRMLAKALNTLTKRGLLRIDDSSLAAEQLTWLVVAAPLNRLTLQPDTHPYTEKELHTLATEGVKTFLSRYGPAVATEV